MFNPNAIRVLKPTPGQAAVLASFGSIYQKNPNLIRQLLSKHEQNFTGNPNMDLMQLYHLQRNRGDFFTRDLEKTWSDAKYFSIKGLGESLQNLGQNILDKGGDLLSQAAPVMGNLMQSMAPLAGLAAQAGAEAAGVSIPGIGNIAAGLTNTLGGLVGNIGAGSGKGPGDPTQGVPQTQITTTQSTIPASLEGAINAAFAAGQNSALDSRPGSQQVLNELTKDPNQKKFLGMPRTTGIIVTIVGSILLLAIIITVVIYFRNKSKKASKKD